MKHLLLTGMFSALSMLASAQTFKEWQDPNVNEVNRAPMHAYYFAYESEAAAQKAVKENSGNFMSLNGDWKFNWVKNADERPMDFWKTGFNDKAWKNLQIPAVWELNGYGDPIYVNNQYAWRNFFKTNPPHVPVENNHVGSYRREITVPANWSGKDIYAHFGSVTSCMYLWVNGKFVGYSEDSKLEAEFNLTPYLVPGKKNLIAFQVFRWCDGTYLEDQDFFRYSGVARDCYLYSRNKKHIQDIRVTPDLDTDYKNGSLAVNLRLAGSGKVNLQLKDADGKAVASATSNGGSVKMDVPNPHKWTAETPYLYKLYATMDGSNEVIPLNVGFRKIELKGNQVLVNGKAVLFKGANRHEMDPDGGYVISRQRMLEDIKLMKEYNINAVRTCHYPDDSYWYDLCDKYGIYMVAEANLESHGMGYGKETLAKNKSFAKAHLERNERNVQRNFNHPAIIFWSLGNEAGFGPNFEAAYRWVKKEDTSRPVQYEQAHGNQYTDINCPMYANYDYMEKYAKRTDTTKPLIQCEYAHAMGNSEGGFKEYWDLIRKYPSLQGGFIWDFVDQSPRWKGKNGAQIYAYGGDFNKYDGSDLNFCDNGLIGPDRIPNPHAYEVRYFYQDIWTNPVNLANGEVSVYNENFFRDLSAYKLDWQVLSNGKVVREGTVNDLNVAPGQTENLKLNLGSTTTDKEWLLNVSYKLKTEEGLLPAGYTVARQQLVLNPYKATPVVCENEKLSNTAVVTPQIVDNQANYLIVKGNDYDIEFNRQTGYLSKYQADGLDYLTADGALTPNFWRAPTDNDFGAGLQQRFAAWRHPEIKLVSLKSAMENGLAVIRAEYNIKAVSAKLYLTYTINNEGSIKVNQKMTTTKGAKVSPLFRFGMQMQMPKTFANLSYYGRGPIENYSDRNNCTFLGIYNQTVAEQFYPYIRPQETGTKTDLRWWKVQNTGGNGLQVKADAPFSASALNYTIDSLDEGWDKNQGHSPEVPQADFTNLIIDKAQMGLGCVNSWGAWPLPQYQLPYQDYDFTFMLSPVQHNVDL